MDKLLAIAIAIAIISVSVFALGGCASSTVNMNPDSPMSQAGGPILSTAAQLALDQAKIDVASAERQNALWTTAQNELAAAEAAAVALDNAAVIAHAQQASELAKLGIAQLSLPTTEPFK